MPFPVRSALRFLFLLTAVMAPTALFGAAEPDAKIGQAPAPSLAGRILVAAPGMPAARFQKIVIVIVRNGPEGSMGLVINRPAGENPWESLFAVLGERREGVTGTFPLFSGGPIQPELFFGLHTTDYRLPESIAVTSEIATTASPKILHDIIDGNGPRKYMISFGYVGWAPGQLEGELGINAWFTAPLDLPLVFDADRSTLWEQMVTAHGTP
ncbi:MAG: YqgE/AlgH family protein [Alphaproteobacteria bacterium]|nr:YqgE/AlgH family protein [Alphaproteobacteria bacterium]